MDIIISGKVIKGDGFGRKLGYPTANLDKREYIRRKIKIKFGVWAGTAELKVKSGKLKVYKAAIVIGPPDKHQLPKIEAHLLNFKGNLYGKKVTITLQKYLRPFKKFKNMEELKSQIKKDLFKIQKN